MSVTNVLLDILVAAKVAAEIAERIGFPPVVAEILAGVVIGPSCSASSVPRRHCASWARSA